MHLIRDFSTIASLSSIITESDSSPVPTKEGRVLGIKMSSGDNGRRHDRGDVGDNNVVFGLMKDKEGPTFD